MHSVRIVIPAPDGTPGAPILLSFEVVSAPAP
jgi:hypothetical protein